MQLNSFRTGLRFNVCIVGRRFLIRSLSKALGLKRFATAVFTSLPLKITCACCIYINFLEEDVISTLFSTGRWKNHWPCGQVWTNKMVYHRKIIAWPHRQAMPREVNIWSFAKLCVSYLSKHVRNWYFIYLWWLKLVLLCENCSPFSNGFCGLPFFLLKLLSLSLLALWNGLMSASSL